MVYFCLGVVDNFDIFREELVLVLLEMLILNMICVYVYDCGSCWGWFMRLKSVGNYEV